jgi:hypothetical protein
LDFRQLDTGVDQRAQGHIAANATGTVQVRNSHVFTGERNVFERANSDPPSTSPLCWQT